MNKCFRSYPVLSLRKVPSMSSTVPFARTTSKPEVEFRRSKRVNEEYQVKEHLHRN